MKAKAHRLRTDRHRSLTEEHRTWINNNKEDVISAEVANPVQILESSESINTGLQPVHTIDHIHSAVTNLIGILPDNCQSEGHQKTIDEDGTCDVVIEEGSQVTHLN